MVTSKEHSNLSLVVTVAAAASCLASSTTLRPAQTKNVAKSTISLPLHPHHAVVERRKRELRQRILDGTDADEEPPQEEEEQQSSRSYYETQPKMAQLYQGNFGNFYMDLYIGTPPQRQTVTIDTAAVLTALSCSDGDGGHGDHTNLFFDELSSRTFVKYDCGDMCLGKCMVPDYGPDSHFEGEERCMFNQTYGTSGSYTAYQVTDRAYPGGPHGTTLYPPLHWEDGMSGVIPDHSSAFTFRLTFGCEFKDRYGANGVFPKELSNGVAGFGPSDLALWKQMSWDDVVPKSGFSLCFPPHYVTNSMSGDKNGTESGAITIGGTDSRLHNTPMVYAKDVRNASLPDGKYTVNLRKVYLRRHGGESVKPDFNRLDEVLFEMRDVDQTELNRGGVTISSMIMGVYMRNVVEGPFRAEWKKLTGFDYKNTPQPLTSEEVEQLPTILLQLEASEHQTIDVSDPYVVTGLAAQLGDQDYPNDVVVAIPPRHYMVHNPKDDTYRSFFYFLESTLKPSMLGANFLMGHDVHFDVDNKAIGFSESLCDYSAVVEDEMNILSEKESTKADNSSPRGIVDNDWNKCGGWCIFGKIMLACITVVACVGCFLQYKRYVAKKQSYEEESALKKNVEEMENEMYKDGEEQETKAVI